MSARGERSDHNYATRSKGSPPTEFVECSPGADATPTKAINVMPKKDYRNRNEVKRIKAGPWKRKIYT